MCWLLCRGGMEALSWGQIGAGSPPPRGMRADVCRFRLINSAAREVLVKGGWARTEETGKAKAREKKGRK